MKIKIIAVEHHEAADKNGKAYIKLEVSYKNITFNKVESKLVMPFGVTADVHKTLMKADAGEFYEVSVVKNDKGYNDWVSIETTSAEAPAPAVSKPAAKTAAASASVPVASKSTGGSTYATEEERAKTQVYIVRQSSITAALKMLELNKAKSVSVEETLAIARQFENYVFGINTPELVDMPDDLPPAEAYDDDIPC